MDEDGPSVITSVTTMPILDEDDGLRHLLAVIEVQMMDAASAANDETETRLEFEMSLPPPIALRLAEIVEAVLRDGVPGLSPNFAGLPEALRKAAAAGDVPIFFADKGVDAFCAILRRHFDGAASHPAPAIRN